MSDLEMCGWVILVCCSELQHIDLATTDPLARLTIPSFRYSGEPATSIGNALLNHFVLWSHPMNQKLTDGLNESSIVSMHEGDDGIVGAEAPFDLSSWATGFGFNLDVDWFADMRCVKFCGRYMSGPNVPRYRSVADIRRTLDKMHFSVGVLGAVSHLSLLRAKVLSTFSLDPATPIISHVAWACWHRYDLKHAELGSSRDDRWKLILAGTTAEPGIMPPYISDEDYECVKCQGLDPLQAKTFCSDIERAIHTGGPFPLMDFGGEAAKVTLHCIASI